VISDDPPEIGGFLSQGVLDFGSASRLNSMRGPLRSPPEP
jgi:hypothetical protein